MPQVQVLNDVTARYNIDSMVDGGGSGGGSFTGGIMVIHEVANDLGKSQLDKTWQEIFDAMKSGILVILNNTVEDTPTPESKNNIITSANANLGTYSVAYFEGDSKNKFSTDLPDGYPELEGGVGGGGVV